MELRFYHKPVTSNRSEMYFRATQMLTTDAEGRFRPDGSTNLGRGAGTHWTLTLVNWKPGQ